MSVAIVLAVALLAQPQLPVRSAVVEPNADFDPDSCSLYCAAGPDVVVSAHLARQSRVQYGADRLTDGKGRTAWIVDKGPGEWFEFAFHPSGFHPDFPVDNDRTGVDVLFIWNGYNKSPVHWREHGRVRELELAIDGKAVAIVTLLDDPRPQTVGLPKTLLRRGMRFRFTIRSVFPGDRFDETAVSEARLDGFGHH